MDTVLWSTAMLGPRLGSPNTCLGGRAKPGILRSTISPFSKTRQDRLRFASPCAFITQRDGARRAPRSDPSRWAAQLAVWHATRWCAQQRWRAGSATSLAGRIGALAAPGQQAIRRHDAVVVARVVGRVAAACACAAGAASSGGCGFRSRTAGPAGADGGVERCSHGLGTHLGRLPRALRMALACPALDHILFCFTRPRAAAHEDRERRPSRTPRHMSSLLSARPRTATKTASDRFPYPLRLGESGWPRYAPQRAAPFFSPLVLPVVALGTHMPYTYPAHFRTSRAVCGAAVGPTSEFQPAFGRGRGDSASPFTLIVSQRGLAVFAIRALRATIVSEYEGV